MLKEDSKESFLEGILKEDSKEDCMRVSVIEDSSVCEGLQFPQALDLRLS